MDRHRWITVSLGWLYAIPAAVLVAFGTIAWIGGAEGAWRIILLPLLPLLCWLPLLPLMYCVSRIADRSPSKPTSRHWNDDAPLDRRV